ncbi:MAG TPA: hypothetical protein VGO58_19805 [Chitinophagaceae bacterium]|jgi:hypothetical protein|nr:hypothetical protein [Chitinophagaceae bacterium]
MAYRLLSEAWDMNDRFIIESFWQRGANCAAVAFIKALLCRYGLRAGLRVMQMATGKKIIVPGGVTMLLSEREIDHINKKNQISFRRFTAATTAKKQQAVRRTVKMIFAVLVYAMETKGMSRAKALHVLTREGTGTMSLHRWLGIHGTPVRRVTKTSLNRIRKMKAVLLYNAGHIIVASAGYYDNNGHAEKLNGEIPMLLGEPASHWKRVI